MIYIIGIGPGDIDGLTVEALEALKTCEIISGYKVYVDLVKKFLPDKVFAIYPMRREIERCQQALEFSKQGMTVALISSGDSGVYGMAGLMLEVQDLITKK